MQTRNRVLDDLAKVANSAAGTMAGLKDEIENLIRYRVEGLMSNLNMVSREEFDVAKAMATKALTQQALLEKRIEELEANMQGPAPMPRTKKKTAGAKKSAKK